jgi:hypothetical protein
MDAATEPVATPRRGARTDYAGIQYGSGSTWPRPLPKLTGPEALAAAKLLWRKAMGRAWPGKWKLGRGNHRSYPRFQEFLVNPGQGWEGMVHDLSHAAYSRLCGRQSQRLTVVRVIKPPHDNPLYPGKSYLVRSVHDLISKAKKDDYSTALRKSHSSDHALVERMMIQMVIESGWLEGSLKPQPKEAAPRVSVRERNEARVDAGIVRWEAKLKKAKADAAKAEKKLKEFRLKKRRYEKIVFKL